MMRSQRDAYRTTDTPDEDTRLQQLFEDVRVLTSTVSTITRVPWVTAIAGIPRISNVAEVSQTLIHDLAIIKFSHILSSQPVDVCSPNLTDCVSIEGMDETSVDEALCLSRRRIQIICHE